MPAQTLPLDVDAYIAACSAPARDRLHEMRAIIAQEAPGAAERIAWKMPTFQVEQRRVHIAAFKDHVSLIPGAGAVEAFADELDTHGLTRTKGTVGFPLDQPIPEDLVRRIVRFQLG